MNKLSQRYSVHSTSLVFAIAFFFSLSPSFSLFAAAPENEDKRQASLARPSTSFGRPLGAEGSGTVTARRTDQRSPDGLTATKIPVLVSQWDGTAEAFYRSPNVGQGVEFIQLLTMPEDQGTIDEVTACFALDQAVVDFTYEVLLFSNSGGQPGALIAATELTVPGTTVGEVCITGEVNIAINKRRIFVGVYLPDVGDTFFGFDSNGQFTSQGFYRFEANDPWEQLPDTQFPEYRNLALDLEFTGTNVPPPPQTCPAQACVPGDETLCLLNGEFKVTADFRNKFDDAGPMKAGALITPDTGFLHFPGSPNNVEVVVKVIDACSAFDRFWVFAGGLTDQEVTLKVCDTVTGQSRTYFNALNSQFSPITDTQAFATCP